MNDSGSSGSTALADVFSKALFGDPEAQAKAAMMGAQIRAHDAYTTKLGADTALVQVKTREEQALEDAQNAAGAPTGAALAASVPAPVPVEAPRPADDSFGSYGPQPGIVTPQAQAQHDATVKMLSALGPVIVRTGNSPQGIVEAVGKGIGLGTLVGGLNNPNQPNLRVGGGLYTGSAPSTTTVWGPNDTAGVDAASRADTVKPVIKDLNGGFVTIQNGQAVPVAGAEPGPKAPTTQTVNGVLYQLDPKTGGWTRAPGVAPPEPKTLQGPDGRTYQQNPDNTWSPAPGVGAKPAETKEVNGVLYQQNPDGTWSKAVGVDQPPPKVVPFSKNDTPYTINPDGTISPTQGFQPPPKGGAFPDTSTEGAALNMMPAIAQKMADPTAAITPDEARNYAAAYAHLYQPKSQLEQRPDGSLVQVLVPPTIPAGQPRPEDVLARAGIKLADAPIPPVASGPAPAPPPAAAAAGGPPPVNSGAPPQVGPNGVTITPLAGGGSKPPTEAQAKDRAYAEMLVTANQTLDKFNGKNAPGAATRAFLTADNPAANWITSQMDDASKNWGQAAQTFIEAYGRPASGASIRPEEWSSFTKIFIPVYGDTPEIDARKKLLRDNLGATIRDNGFAGDLQAKLDFMKRHPNATALDVPVQAGGGPAGGGGGPAAKPANAPPEWDSLSDRGKALWLKVHGGQ